MNRGPSAFAPGRGGGGRAISWESLALTTTPQEAVATFPTQVTPGIRTRALLPGDVARGVVTLERVRGSIAVYFEQGVNDLQFWSLDLMLQLIPLKAGGFVTSAVLNPRDGNDLESNRIIWRQRYYNPEAINIATVSGIANNFAFDAIDIKSRRRFDRALWALHLVLAVGSGFESAARFHLDLRALFRSPDGL